ncbi:MAG: DUF3089 domain-containing protein [Lachnospiraceae bacterium]|nr:DUF3089 domain-containing protein [Lachnospiraceae bacterium]
MKKKSFKKISALFIAGILALSCTEPLSVKAKLPVTVSGRYEEDANRSLPGFTYALNSVHKVDGRQGIACENEEFYVSGSTSLSHYDKDWNLVASNSTPFEEFSKDTSVNHIGDIDVYNGEIYAGVEYFMEGKASDIQIAIYDAETLKLKRYYSFAPESGQTECSGITVDADNHSVWMCAWEDGESGRYLYRYNLDTGEYLGKYHLQCPPQWIQGIVYYDGWIYITADDGTADDGEPDHIYRCLVDLNKTSFNVILERTLDDVILQGEIEGISVDRENKRMLVSYNRGSQIVLGMVKGFYDGYTEEIHEIFTYDMARNFRELDYSLDDYWVNKPAKIKKSADVFFVLPTVNMKNFSPDNDDILSKRNATRYYLTYNMEKAIAEYSANVFAPLYRQATLGSCMKDGNLLLCLDEEYLSTLDYFDIAYADIKNAFEYYLENLNDGRGIVLFGYSQGGEMIKRLLSEYGEDKRFTDKYIAAYIIGAPVTESYMAANPYLKAAKGKKDTGVIVSFNAVDARLKYTGEKEISINPLNWKTSSKKADASLNKGYVSYDTYGKVSKKIPNYCGAYIDKKTGKLVVTDIEDQDALYETDTKFFEKGDYHLYELSFFCQNLKKNIATRIKTYNSRLSS